MTWVKITTPDPKDTYSISSLVTTKDYAAYLKANPSAKPPKYWQEQVKYPKLPVLYVSWFEAMEFAQWKTATLPTEKQWQEAVYKLDGTVFEWCLDTEPKNYRVVRGGAWRFDSRFLRAAYRSRTQPVYRYNNIGFRCARKAESD